MSRQDAINAILEAVGITSTEQLDLVDRLISLEENVAGRELAIYDDALHVDISIIRPFGNHNTFLQYLSSHSLPATEAESEVQAGSYSVAYDPIEVEFIHQPTYEKYRKTIHVTLTETLFRGATDLGRHANK